MSLRTGGPALAPLRTARWALLAAFGLLVASTQLLWISLAPVTGEAARALGVSEGAVGDLAGLEPVVYVLLAIPAGRWMDRRFGPALTLGALLTAGGALVRAAGPQSYAWVLAGQVAIAVGQPLVLNATTKVAARWFPPAERATAISVASAGQFVGILVAATTGGLLLDAGGLRLLLGVHAAVATAGALAVLVALRLPAAFEADATGPTSLGWLRHDPLMWRLAALLFVGVGVFNAVATWLDPILDAFGHPGVGGGLIALMTVTGIAGAAVLPGMAARRDRRRLVLVATTGLTVTVFGLLSLVHALWLVTGALAVLGFFLLAGLPVALDWSELEAGPGRAATATAFLLLAGNLGGAVLVLVVQALMGTPHLALAALAVAAVPGVLVALRLPDRAPVATAAEPSS
ncbi:MAG: MFS transporter [Actinobacteria bacterium]|nr:MFS transporter [Actinomycetota bacterium]